MEKVGRPVTKTSVPKEVRIRLIIDTEYIKMDRDYVVNTNMTWRDHLNEIGVMQVIPREHVQNFKVVTPFGGFNGFLGWSATLDKKIMEYIDECEGGSLPEGHALVLTFANDLSHTSINREPVPEVWGELYPEGGTDEEIARYELELDLMDEMEETEELTEEIDPYEHELDHMDEETDEEPTASSSGANQNGGQNSVLTASTSGTNQNGGSKRARKSARTSSTSSESSMELRSKGVKSRKLRSSSLK